MAREGVPLIVIQRQLGHTNLGITSVYLQGIDNTEIIDAVHSRRAPMVLIQIASQAPGSERLAECSIHRRSQATAAPPGRVSDLLTNEGGAVMPRGFGLSEVTKEAIWKLRAQGLSDREVGRRLGLARGSVSNHLARMGGIRPRARRRPEMCLSFEEREEVSRAIAGGQSARAI